MILAFLNQKGGVGKSTLSLNAAHYLVKQGASVLLIDADPQGTSSKWASLREEPPFPVIALARENMAKEIIKHAQNYDHVVVDGPPRAEALSRAVIIASDLVVLPVEASGASDWASEVTIEQVKEASQYKETLKAVFLCSRIISGTVLGKAIREHLADHGIPLLSAFVTNRVQFAEALTMAQTIYEYAASSDAAKELTTMMEELEAFYEQDILKADETSQHAANG